MSNFNRKINKNKSQQKVYNTKYYNVSKSVDKETFDYGLNLMSQLLSNRFSDLLVSNKKSIKCQDDFYSLCSSVKSKIAKKGFLPFKYKNYNYGVILKEFYIENIDNDMNIKFYIGTDVGILEEDYSKKHNLK